MSSGSLTNALDGDMLTWQVNDRFVPIICGRYQAVFLFLEQLSQEPIKSLTSSFMVGHNVVVRGCVLGGMPLWGASIILGVSPKLGRRAFWVGGYLGLISVQGSAGPCFLPLVLC